MTPRASKRPYQPSISAYFHRTIPPPPPPHPPCPSSLRSRETIDRDEDAEPPDGDGAAFFAVSHSLTHAVTRRPPPPAAIQSSLLSVGMRVRKAVPEGYQTGCKTQCRPTKLGAASASAPAAPETPAAGTASAPGSGGGGERGGRGGVGAVVNNDYYRGLVPYCGILKVGGHAIQPVPAEEDLPPLLFDDDWSLPPSYQDSNTCFVPNSGFSSTFEQSPPRTTASRKRPHDDADDEDECGLKSLPLSPGARPVSHTRMPNLDCIKHIAVPRSRRKPGLELDGNSRDGGGSDGGGAPECEMVDVDDFEEASFFRATDWGMGEDDRWSIGNSRFGG